MKEASRARPLQARPRTQRQDRPRRHREEDRPHHQPLRVGGLVHHEVDQLQPDDLREEEGDPENRRPQAGAPAGLRGGGRLRRAHGGKGGGDGREDEADAPQTPERGVDPDPRQQQQGAGQHAGERAAHPGRERPRDARRAHRREDRPHRGRRGQQDREQQRDPDRQVPRGVRWRRDRGVHRLEDREKVRQGEPPRPRDRLQEGEEPRDVRVRAPPPPHRRRADRVAGQDHRQHRPDGRHGPAQDERHALHPDDRERLARQGGDGIEQDQQTVRAGHAGRTRTGNRMRPAGMITSAGAFAQGIYRTGAGTETSAGSGVAVAAPPHPVRVDRGGPATSDGTLPPPVPRQTTLPSSSETYSRP